ncbi:hypothetical protein [Rhodobacter sp. 24-YEA-8]|uniref:hypothetical protein n=1 Tax=Rhodobacter sp. 24-YEA-8 TaxID=1884310 RepID=UPI000B8467C2|nr:hypothetical protein [Rhodobacter sp. 24-YEA-8]
MTNYINFALQQMRQWAQQFDTHICLIAHPKKMSTQGKTQCPTGYDIADSAAFFNKPALGFSVHASEADGGDELEILFGPLSGWRVAFTALRGQMIEGELSMLGTVRKVRVPASDIHMRKG